MVYECWNAGLHKGESVNPRGYGQAWLNGKTIRIHREVFAAYNGYYPEEVMHTCDNRSCYNPAHLVGGDHAANMADMVAKGRGRGSQGEDHHNSKLTETQVLKIREELVSGGPRGYQTRIAEKYGISKYTVSLIKQGKIWTHC